MEEYKDNVPVQAGEFIIVENGEAHILCWIEDWPDAPAESSGFRLIEPVGCYLKHGDIIAAGAKGGFVEFESECRQYIPDESYEQGDLDLELSKGFEAVAFADFVKHHPDGMYFVLEAPRMSYGLSAQIMDEWKTWKRKTGNPHPSADVALAWISGAFAEEHPELDFASMRDEVFTMISCEEEPCVDPDHYNDGLIDVRVIQDFCLTVFTSCSGKTKAVPFDSNFYAPMDLVEAYSQLFDPAWNEDKEKCLNSFKTYLYACGCTQEDLEGCGDE